MSDRGEELAALCKDLVSDPAYITGRRTYPRTVTMDDVADVALAVQHEVDQAIRMRDARAAEQGLKLACERGCSKCCEEIVMVTLPEAALLARWLRRPENAEALAAFRDRFAAWQAAVGDTPQRMEDAAQRGDQAEYVRLHTDNMMSRTMCAFNQDGVCQVYEVRPLICRRAHALDTAELCGPHPVGLGRRKQIDFPPLEQFSNRMLGILWAGHHAAGGARMRRDALCAYVMKLVDAAP
ncbi:MAG: hypothetical protein IT370_00265 [Deltaproteobacteria bacterium]|nr:hypothetical protein [Deltaproteobacteria bacterium]